MVTNIELSTAERGALAEAYELLGDNLANFLLSGLGDEGVSHRRTFTAGSKPSHKVEITYQLELINDSGPGLPAGRDPVVLATLLDILWERQPLDSTILFRQADILEKLGWDDKAESHYLIKRALERYAFTAYCLVEPTATEEEGYGSRYASVGRLLIGYEMSSPHYPLKKRGQLKYAKSEPFFASAQFLPGLIHDVISERKTFLGIDFQRLQKIQPQAITG